MFSGKKVLITGGTGSLGRALTKRLLETEVDVVRIYSREEFKQIQMQSVFDDKRLRFLIGDVRDKERLTRALEDIDIIFHAAALKHVPIAEYNPIEAVKTNVYGTQNLIESSLDKDVKVVIAIGTDKAVSPLNTYGATKLLMEKMLISANFYKGNHKVKFTCVRYGNVLGSRGSVVPTFVNDIKNYQRIRITDPEMTRFNITMDQSIDLMFRAIHNGLGGEVFIPKLKAYRLGDIQDAILELLDLKVKTESIPIRSGEKFHETLINIDEIRNAFETKEDYILFDKNMQNYDYSEVTEVQKCKLIDRYSSDKVELLKKDELKNILRKEKLL